MSQSVGFPQPRAHSFPHLCTKTLCRYMQLQTKAQSVVQSSCHSCWLHCPPYLSCPSIRKNTLPTKPSCRRRLALCVTLITLSRTARPSGTPPQSARERGKRGRGIPAGWGSSFLLSSPKKLSDTFRVAYFVLNLTFAN